MSRPKKRTVDYFPHYVNHKKTIPLLKSKFGSDGYSVFFQTLEILGKNDGHFYDFSDEIDWLFFVSEMGVSEEKTLSILEFCVRLKAFDDKLFKNKIIWSDNFTDGLSNVYKKRSVSAPERPVSVSKTIVPGTRNPQSKVKYSKVEETFVQFWKTYPKKKSKVAAIKAFSKINPDKTLLKKIIKALMAQKNTDDWIKDRGRYIPLPASWLNGEMWNDEISTPSGGNSDADFSITKKENYCGQCSFFKNSNKEECQGKKETSLAGHCPGFDQVKT